MCLKETPESRMQSCYRLTVMWPSKPSLLTHTHTLNQPVTPGVSHSPGQEPAPQLSLSAVL